MRRVFSYLSLECDRVRPVATVTVLRVDVVRGVVRPVIRELVADGAFVSTMRVRTAHNPVVLAMIRRLRVRDDGGGGW